MDGQRFRDRREAGRVLAGLLRPYAGRSDTVVLALPRGGVPVAYEVAKALHAPLDVFLVRKLGVPAQPELAMGAIASGGVRVMNEQIVDGLGISEDAIARVAARESLEIARREHAYRGGHVPLPLGKKAVILIDDGLATGATMRAAARAIKTQQPSKLVVAVPVAAASTCDEFRDEVDEILCAQTPEPFYAVGLWYRDFSPTTDEEVRMLLDRAMDASSVS